MTITVTKDQIEVEERCREAVRAINNGSRATMVAHITNLKSVEMDRLLTQSDTVRIHRAQGAAAAYDSIINLLMGNDGS